jgi:hypothetical protein
MEDSPPDRQTEVVSWTRPSASVCSSIDKNYAKEGLFHVDRNGSMGSRMRGVIRGLG